MAKKNKLNEPFDGSLEPKEFKHFFEDCQETGIKMSITSTVDENGINKTTINVPSSSRFKVTKSFKDGILSKYRKNFGLKNK